MHPGDRSAVVTGAATGVGRATALALAERGCAVAVNYSKSRDAAEAVAAEARAKGVKAIAIQADVASDADCRRLVDTAVAELGGLDILVNNAGTTRFINHADLEAVTDDDWSRILGVNLKGPFQCARAARKHLEAGDGGVIINVSSVAGVYATGSSIPYCASKAALNNLTVILARVMGPKVRVNAVAPGFIEGEWLKEGLGELYEPVRNSFQQRSLVKKVSTPESIAAAILSLIEGSDVVTGQVLIADGGVGVAG
ncbi:MAG: SDR family oxidoreductase [Deltaproteobacteria bacterium]|nr:SDR family oxidoreductase [Deltaproteobacteria bacterium]